MYPVEIIAQVVLVTDEVGGVGLAGIKEAGNVDAFDCLDWRLIEFHAEIARLMLPGAGPRLEVSREKLARNSLSAVGRQDVRLAQQRILRIDH